jgi:co-chaperonin GroES (HSP10)
MSNTIAVPDSGLILPPGVVPTVERVDPEDVENQSAEAKAKQLPDPQGWKLLCALIEVDDAYVSGLIKADVTKKTEELTSPVLFVIKVGPSAYKDTEKFPDGPWCKEGDFVITRPYTGTRIMIHGREFRVINDDQVEAVVQDPRGISRA